MLRPQKDLKQCLFKFFKKLFLGGKNSEGLNAVPRGSSVLNNKISKQLHRGPKVEKDYLKENLWMCLFDNE